jgi:uncharacterized protein
LSLPNIVTMIAIGLLTGSVVGLTGASGVNVVVPLLTLLLHLSVQQAIGTSLLVDVIASISVALTYFRYGNVHLGTSFWIAIGSILGAQLGALVANRTSEAGLGSYFGLSMIFLGVLLLLRPGGKKRALERKIQFNLSRGSLKTAASVLIGLFIGAMTGINGSSGGLAVMVVLVLLLDFPIHIAIGTSTVIMIMTASSGALGYALPGNIDWIVGGMIGVSAAAGGMISARFANHISDRTLNLMISLLFIGLGVVMSIIYLTRLIG